MANKLYPLGAQKLLSGQINMAADTLKLVLLPATYTFSAVHEFLSDLGTVVGAAATLANKTVAGGVFDADNAEFSAVASGSTATFVVLFKDTGNPTTSPLIFFADTLTGFPMATNGGDITVKWDDGAMKVFSLVP